MRPDPAFYSLMEVLLGTEFAAFEKSFSEKAFRGLRVNELKISAKEFATCSPFVLSPVPWCPEGFYYKEDVRPGKHPYFDAGVYYIQEPSAMAVGAIADAKPGEWVLDLCAAPGGKTTHLASRMKGQGFLLANEFIPSRAKILSQNVERMGIQNCVVTNESPARLSNRFAGLFDLVVVDAPCSGEGMFRRDETAVSEWSPEAPERCAARQQEILEEAIRLVKPGGRLVYSTCTFNPLENEGTIDKLLRYHSEISLSNILYPFSPGHPDWIMGGSPALAETARLWPHKIAGEGHFLALLTKTDGISPQAFTPSSVLCTNQIPAEYTNFLAESLNRSLTDRLIQGGDRLWRLPAGIPVLDGLKVLRAGLELGTLKKGRFEPAHALALALPFDDVKHSENVSPDSPALLQYLRGETLYTELPNGWATISVNRFPLGWGKQVNGILKNHFPKGLRHL